MKTNTNLLMNAVFLAAALNSFGQPAIITEPRDQLAIPGQRITFSVQANGTVPLSFAWSHNDAPLPGKTNSSLVFTNVQVLDTGSYAVVVADASGSGTSRAATLTVIGPVPLDPKLSANIRLGDDPATLPSNLRAQAEPHIARSNFDPNLLVAIFQEGRYTDGGAVSCGYSVSTNAGLTWTRALIPGLTAVNGGLFGRASDPVAAFDLKDNIILNTLTLPPSPPPVAVVVSISTNKGATFSTPIEVDQRLSSGNPDKQWIAINTFPGAPHPNRMFIAYTHENAGYEIVRVFSDDGGVTWSSRKVITPGNSYTCQPMFLPDGKLAMVYNHYLSGIDTARNCRIEMVFSNDGGETFEVPTRVTASPFDGYVDPIARSNWGDPSAATDRQGGVLYVAYNAVVGPPTNRVPQILFTKSIDKGSTWSAAMVVNDTPLGRGVFNPTIAVSPDGQHVTIAFYDKRNQSTNSANNYVDFYLAESFDGGDTWAPNVRLSDVSSDLRLAPLTGDVRMLADYQGIVPALNLDTPGAAVWIDTRTGNPDPYVVRIQRTKGTTFGAWRKLRFSTNDLANASISGDNADPDQDGIPNVAEYAFGLEPRHADNSPLDISKSPSGLNTTVTVSCQRLALLSDIQFSWETSENLVAWTAASLPRERFIPGRDPSMQRVEASFPLGDRMKFFRLGITRMNPTP